MKNALNVLPCFTKIDKISVIRLGLSQSCFKVSADNKLYFAKTVTEDIEVTMAVCASKSGLSPTVIYHDQDWLIYNFINAENLAQNTSDIEEKIEHVIKLMVQCHQLTIKPTKLAPKNIINSLVNNAYYTSLQKSALLQFAEIILIPLNNKNSVCCHGDLNFSNIIINQAQRTWLVDYECACTAPIEFDLAMFVAVNNIDSNEITTIIEQYQVQSPVNIDQQLLNHYLSFCYFVNALWYFNTYHEKTHTKDKSVLLRHAKKQWYTLHSSLKINDSPLLSGLSIKLTDILTTFDFSNQT